MDMGVDVAVAGGKEAEVGGMQQRALDGSTCAVSTARKQMGK
jgi:hypothetical protein